MKAALFALILGASTMASAGPIQPLASSDLSLSAGSGASAVFETKGRTGSKRVGGKGRSGKGGRYVGGHR
nr:hypothetical protein [uncultured Albidiferax sp.]